MDEDTAQRLKRQAENDQFLAASTTFGELLAQRRQLFINAGVPKRLADTLLRDMHWLYTCKGLWPDTPPKRVGGEDE